MNVVKLINNSLNVCNSGLAERPGIESAIALTKQKRTMGGTANIASLLAALGVSACGRGEGGVGEQLELIVDLGDRSAGNMRDVSSNLNGASTDAHSTFKLIIKLPDEPAEEFEVLGLSDRVTEIELEHGAEATLAAKVKLSFQDGLEQTSKPVVALKSDFTDLELFVEGANSILLKQSGDQTFSALAGDHLNDVTVVGDGNLDVASTGVQGSTTAKALAFEASDLSGSLSLRITSRPDNIEIKGTSASDTVTLLGNFSDEYTGEIGGYSNGTAGAHAFSGSIDFGSGDQDTLVIYGAVDLRELSLSGVERLDVNSVLVIEASQLMGLSEVAFSSESSKPSGLILVNDMTDEWTDSLAQEVASKLTIADGGTLYVVTTQADESMRVDLTSSMKANGSNVKSMEIGLNESGELDVAAVIRAMSDDEDAPVFTSGATATAIDENGSAGATVYTAATTDASTVTYSLAGDDATAFTIDETSGAVTINAAANYEAKTAYSFDVIATDAAGNSATQAVTLDVNDLDEDAPVFTSGATATAIDENGSAGATVYTAATTDASEVTYSLSGDDASAFTINETSGAVTINAAANYEAKTAYSFDVIATDAAGNSATQAVTLDVNDLDDDAPVFTSGATATAIDENGSAGATVYTAETTDASTVTYSLSGDDASAFTIDATTGAVTINAAADYETKTAYSFDVIATDAAGNSATQAVTLDVNDLDEDAPVFTSGATATAIDENGSAGATVYTAATTDASTVTYSLAGDDATAFTIDETSGAVTINAAANYEAKTAYSFDVIATDAAGNSATQAVTLDVNDLDEDAPVFTSGATATAIDENGSAGATVYTAATTDASEVTYSLSGDDASAFTIDETSGAVTINAAADYETKTAYSFDVIATDAAGNSATQAVTLDVNDLDDDAPVFTSGATATAIDENGSAGATVYTAATTDASTVTYSLSGDDASAFTIDETSGAVTINAAADYETKTAYSFDVIATDAAGNSATQAVTLDVNDLDDDAPVFTSGATATAIDENGSAGATVYTAETTDASTVTYSLSGDDASAFTIDETSGAVTINAAADYETKTAYSFDVIATDAAGNSATQAVTLDVNDLDDDAPVFTSGATATAIDENGSAGATVYTAETTDASTVTYSLSGDDASAFTIDETSGAVTINAAADYETKTAYSFDVIATDAAGNSATQAVTLDVNDLDDDAPVFTSGATATAIDENGSAGATVYTAETTDASTVTYSLSGDDASAFTIDATTGAVTINAAADYETKTAYSFDVIATDAAGNSATQAVTLDVNDLDEDAPVFTSGATATAIDENGSAGATVYTAATTDASTVTYSLSGDDASAFTIDETSGAVTINAAADYETKTAYSFDVIATDAAGNSATQAVTLDVNDLDDDAPVFTSGATATAIDENGSAGATVYTAETTDASTVTYSLSGDDASAFTIDETSGAVTINAAADYETKTAYSFDVIATDAAGNSATQAVTLDVNDLDDDAPVFTSGATATAIDENGSAGATVYTAETTDASTVTYSLSGDDASAFTIDETSGAVTINAAADYETKTAYSFDVIATDAAGNSATQAVTLDVNDLDDDAPVFTSGATATAIDENGSAGATVYTAETTDASTVTYSLSGDDASAFTIDATTGAVTINAAADYETKTAYSFDVIATDAAGNSATQAVTLDVNDLDEDAPVFTSGATATAIDENGSAGATVYTAATTDASTVTYSLSGDDASAFTIDETSGAVTINAAADYETKTAYSFDVIATDAAGNSATQAVTLDVNDLDEDAPVFTSGATATAIDENGSAGATVYTAATTDASTVTYSLSGDDASAFTIDETSGAVTINAAADYETKTSYSFDVIATDAAGNSATQAVTLAVNDLDDGPLFRSDDYNQFGSEIGDFEYQRGSTVISSDQLNAYSTGKYLESAHHLTIDSEGNILARHVLSGIDSNTGQMKLVDMDNDGYEDLVYLEGTGLKLRKFDANTTTKLSDSEINITNIAINHAGHLKEVEYDIVDLNGDYIPEIVVSENHGGTVGIYQRNTDGTYARTGGFDPDFDAFEVKALDFNDDGRADFVVAGRGGLDNNPALYLANEDGSYSATTLVDDTFKYAVSGESIGIADFNGDGRTDILTGSVYGDLIIHSNTDGTVSGIVRKVLEKPHDLLNSNGYGIYAEDIKVGDVDGDGSVDILYTGANDNGALRILLNDGTGEFSAATDLLNNDYVGYRIVLADLNRDGATDLLTSFKSAAVYLNQKTDSVAPSQPSVELSGITVTIEGEAGATVKILNGVDDISSKFSVYESGLKAGTYTAVAKDGEFNGSESLTLTATLTDATGNESVASLSVEGTIDTARQIAFQKSESFSTNTIDHDAHIFAADFNGDSRYDILTIRPTANTIELSINESTPGELKFVAATINIDQFDPTNEGYAVPKLVDIDSDGDLDLVVPTGESWSQSPGIAIYKYENGQNFIQSQSKQFGYNTNSISNVEVADFDKDGNIDIAFVTDELMVWFGSNDGQYLEDDIITLATLTSSAKHMVKIGDYNGDGHMDIGAYVYASGSDSNKYLSFHGTGTREFTEQPSITIGRADNSIVLDIDGDGKDELLYSDVYEDNYVISSNQKSEFIFPRFSDFINDPVDLNGDGVVDVIASDYYGNRKTSFFEGDGSGGYTKSDYEIVMYDPDPDHSVDGDLRLSNVVDLDGDGLLDFIYIGNDENTIYTGVDIGF